MVKKIFFSLIFIFAFFIVLALGGFYPVAVVDGSPVFYRTWQRAEGAAIKFAQTSARMAGQAPPDLSRQENAELLLGIKRDTLTFLIEDRIIGISGSRVLNEFEARADAKIEEALRASSQVEAGAKLAYGLGPEDFRELVMLPQARKDVLMETFRARGQNYEEWIALARRSTSVKLYFVPFSWDGEKVR